MQERRFPTFAVIFAMLLFSTSVFAKSPQGSFQKSFSVNGPVDLDVLTSSGDITVRTGGPGTVSVSGKIFVGDGWLSFGGRNEDVSQIEQNPPVQQNGNRIRVDYKGAKNISINFEITVPPDTAVRTHSGSGDQIVEGIRRNLELESGSGDMRLRDISGEVHAQTGSGDLEGRAIAGTIRAEAGSGDVRLEESGDGEVRVHTGSGNIEVKGAKGSLYVEAGSGDVTITGNVASHWSVRTGSGDVRLDLPHEAAFDLDASTSSGDVTVDHPGALEREHHTVKGKVGSGGPPLEVHTGSGDVHIN
jgi:DUF4097 and DUF4098 domain-containing protein YvlB